MILSKLQKYILIQVGDRKGKAFPKKELVKFYKKGRQNPKKDDVQGIITKSAERLIDKGLMIGYGIRTPKKWFIKEIKLTAKGKKEAKKLFGQQQVFPFSAYKTK